MQSSIPKAQSPSCAAAAAGRSSEAHHLPMRRKAPPVPFARHQTWRPGATLAISSSVVCSKREIVVPQADPATPSPEARS